MSEEFDEQQKACYNCFRHYERTRRPYDKDCGLFHDFEAQNINGEICINLERILEDLELEKAEERSLTFPRIIDAIYRARRENKASSKELIKKASKIKRKRNKQ